MIYRDGYFQVGSPEWRAQHGQITKLNLQVLAPDLSSTPASFCLLQHCIFVVLHGNVVTSWQLPSVY